jgi:hypothetical protein
VSFFIESSKGLAATRVLPWKPSHGDIHVFGLFGAREESGGVGEEEQRDGVPEDDMWPLPTPEIENDILGQKMWDMKNGILSVCGL